MWFSTQVLGQRSPIPGGEGEVAWREARETGSRSCEQLCWKWQGWSTVKSTVSVRFKRGRKKFWLLFKQSKRAGVLPRGKQGRSGSLWLGAMIDVLIWWADGEQVRPANSTTSRPCNKEHAHTHTAQEEETQGGCHNTETLLSSLLKPNLVASSSG